MRDEDDLLHNAAGVWEVTTENGTRTWLDFAEGRSLRLPAVHQGGPFDGVVNAMESDWRWKPLRAWSPCRIGERFEYGVSFRNMVLTSRVTSVRRVPEDEVRPYL